MTKVVFFGNERLVSGLDTTTAPILNGLINNGYDVVAVVSHHTFGKSRNDRALEVADVAKKHDIPIFLPSKPDEILTDLKNLQADVAVLVAYGRIVSQKVIDLFPGGIINVHPSLLPQYRGPTPIEAAILNGNTETGVSIMQLTSGMDEGPVYSQQRLQLNGTETKFELYEKISKLVTSLFFDVFPKIIDNKLSPKPQINESASYCSLITKSDGIIDWNESAQTIERKIRAFLGWPQSRTNFGDVEVIITSAHVEAGKETPGKIAQADQNRLLVGTGDGILSIETLKPLGKQEMPISAFLAGYNNRLKN